MGPIPLLDRLLGRAGGDEDEDYGRLAPAEVRARMDERYAQDVAYQAQHLWDRVRGDELNRRAVEMAGPTDGKRVLEVGGGVQGTAAHIDACRSYLGTDLSPVAVRRAKERFADRAGFAFATMDATRLAVADGSVDVVLSKEVIEHLPDPEGSIREAHRVLRPDGVLVVTSPNRDSLHLRINRKLGHQDFKCSFDHVREYTHAEARAMLQDAGFVVDEGAGVFLMPYWGIPQVDKPVRPLTEDDPEVVEMLRELGARAGPEYAFCYVLKAVKPQD